jgi:enamine deaminase RidA (YjgF/YER057c/UK114 family)
MTIERHRTTKRHSLVVVHEQTVYLAGITAEDRSADVAGQTKQVLARIDALLETQQVSRTELLTAQVWLRDIERDFVTFNALWEAWMPEGHAPTRATVEAKMALPDLLIEIMVTAARKTRQPAAAA